MGFFAVKNFYDIFGKIRNNVIEPNSIHKTTAGEARTEMKRQASRLAKDAKVAEKASSIMPGAQIEAKKLLDTSNNMLKEAEAMRLQERLEDLTVYQINKTKIPRKV